MNVNNASCHFQHNSEKSQKTHLVSTLSKVALDIFVFLLKGKLTILPSFTCPFFSAEHKRCVKECW